MTMPGRKYSSGSEYRYGFNRQEKSTEINDNSYTAEFWQYDSRIGRRFNVDPKPNVSISPYVAFENNPIWFNDPLGDSIVDPNRIRAVNVYIVAKKRDKTSDMSAKRLLKTAWNNPGNSIFIESDKLDEKLALDIKKLLGKDGYIGTMVLDYHRSDYDKMPDKEKFYSSLAKGAEGVAGQPTKVLAGMCWAGGGPTFKGDKHPDLTPAISASLDNATVYGLKTQASNLPFRLYGNFGSASPDYYGTAYQGLSAWERKYRSVWTTTSYDPVLKKTNTVEVRQKLILHLNGKIEITKFEKKQGNE